MNFAQMLMQEVSTAPRSGPRGLKGSNKERQERALAKYKQALLPGEWLGTHEIARRAGVNHSTAITVLRSWYGKGLLERRGRDAYEWKWREVK